MVKENPDLFADGNYDDYVPYLVNLALSYYMDTILYANEMNKRPEMPKEMQYKYLVKNVRKYRRPFQKWIKRESLEEVEAVMQYFNISREKSIDALQVLTRKQKDEILLEVGDKNGK